MTDKESVLALELHFREILEACAFNGGKPEDAARDYGVKQEHVEATLAAFREHCLETFRLLPAFPFSENEVRARIGEFDTPWQASNYIAGVLVDFYKADEILPTQIALARAFGVPTVVVKQALELMTAQSFAVQCGRMNETQFKRTEKSGVVQPPLLGREDR